MKREELQHDFHNEQGINWLNSQGEPDIDYVMWLENKILAIKNNTPLPPAEGAEEILNKYPHNIEYPMFIHENNAIAAMQEFATLHAQRIAEKMVEEKMREMLIDYEKWATKIEVQEVTHLYTIEQLVDEYLKWIVSHD